MAEPVEYRYDGEWETHSELSYEDEQTLDWSGINLLANARLDNGAEGWSPLYGATASVDGGFDDGPLLTFPPSPQAREPYLGSVAGGVEGSRDPWLAPIEPGGQYRARVYVRADRTLTAGQVGVSARTRRAGGVGLSWATPRTRMNGATIPSNRWALIEMEMVVGPAVDRLAFGLRIEATVPADATIEFSVPYLDQKVNSTRLEEGEYLLSAGGKPVPVSEDDGLWTIGWSAPQDMTRMWWDMLPEKYREADRAQDPDLPLFRWMAGVGHLMTSVRSVLDDALAGSVMDPELTSAPLWLAQILGIDIAGMSEEDARDAILLRGIGGAAMIGTRDHIGRVAASVLGAGAQVAAIPDDVQPFIIYILTDEVSVTNAGGLERVRERMKTLKSIPAGHVIVPVVVRATWGEFDAAKGDTWGDLMARVRTWAEHDSLGVSLS